MTSAYYVYILFDWMGIPRYVGKGKANRDIAHECKTDPRNWMKNEFIERTWIVLGEVPKIRIYKAPEQNAFETEIALIKVIGRLDQNTGPLTNMADGGEGATSKDMIEQWAKLSSEQRSARGRKAIASQSSEQLSARVRSGWAKLSLEKRSARGRKAWDTLSIEQRNNLRKARANVSSEQLSIAQRKAWAKLSPEQRSIRIRKTHTNQTSEQRSAYVSNGWAKLSPEQRSTRGRKIAARRKANAAQSSERF